MGGQCRGAPKLRAQHLQRGPHRLLVVRRRGDPCKNVRHKGARDQAVLVDALCHVGDQVAVTEMPLALRHTDEHEVMRVGNVDEPLIHAWEIHAYIV